MKKPNKRRPDRSRYWLDGGYWYSSHPDPRGNQLFIGGKLVRDPHSPKDRVRWYYDTQGVNGQNRRWNPIVAE